MVKIIQCAKIGDCIWKGKTDAEHCTPCEVPTKPYASICQFQLKGERQR